MALPGNDRKRTSVRKIPVLFFGNAVRANEAAEKFRNVNFSRAEARILPPRPDSPARARTLRRFKRSTGAKALAHFLASLTRLKSCPDTCPHGTSFSATSDVRTLPSLRAPSFRLIAISALFVAVLAAGCHSYHVDTTIENRTGEPIQLLEVDYPSASYGADSLGSGADFHYRIQIQGKGQLKVLYTTNEGKPVQITGPTLVERQEGRLEVVLLPNGKAEFHPELTPAR
jgi:hypothetical protein